MTKSNSDRLIIAVQELQQFAVTQQNSFILLRWLGYGLLVLAVFDIVETLIPPNFMNPSWEFQTIGSLVERVPVPLIGLVFVFLGEMHSRTKWEIRMLRFLSWFTLLFGVLFILFIPLGIINTVRLNNQTVNQIEAASTQQIAQAEQLEKQLSQATPEQINNFLKRQGRSLDGTNPEEVKGKLLSEITQAKEQIKTQAQSTRSLRGLNLIKTSVKWNLGALIAAGLLLTIWKQTRWARS